MERLGIFYATACIIGAAAYLGLEALGLNLILKTVLSCTIIITVRTIAVVKNYSIPVLNKEV